MSDLPEINLAEIPGVEDAWLPENYVKARTAISECDSIDECLSISDKAAALASYARQARDKTLEDSCKRIYARATQRAGELLKEQKASKGGRPSKKTKAGTRPSSETGADAHPSSSRKAAAQAAGMSDHQRKTALRVAAVPKDEFEKKVESNNPPSVTELAELGTKHIAKDDDAQEFASSIQARRTLHQMAEIAKRSDAEVMVRGASESELKEIEDNIEVVRTWLFTVVYLITAENDDAH
jgi:hypothetical protein